MTDRFIFDSIRHLEPIGLQDEKMIFDSKIIFSSCKPIGENRDFPGQMSRKSHDFPNLGVLSQNRALKARFWADQPQKPGFENPVFEAKSGLDTISAQNWPLKGQFWALLALDLAWKPSEQGHLVLLESYLRDVEPFWKIDLFKKVQRRGFLKSSKILENFQDF